MINIDINCFIYFIPSIIQSNDGNIKLAIKYILCLFSVINKDLKSNNLLIILICNNISIASSFAQDSMNRY